MRPFLLMNGMLIGIIVVFFLLLVLMAVWSRWRRQMGGGLGPTERSDGGMTVQATGYPEEMHGNAKIIGPTDNNAAKM